MQEDGNIPDSIVRFFRSWSLSVHRRIPRLLHRAARPKNLKPREVDTKPKWLERFFSTKEHGTTPIITNLPIALEPLVTGLFGRGSSMLAKKFSLPVQPSTLKSRDQWDRHVRQVNCGTGWGTGVLKGRRSRRRSKQRQAVTAQTVEMS